MGDINRTDTGVNLVTFFSNSDSCYGAPFPWQGKEIRKGRVG